MHMRTGVTQRMARIAAPSIYQLLSTHIHRALCMSGDQVRGQVRQLTRLRERCAM